MSNSNLNFGIISARKGTSNFFWLSSFFLRKNKIQIEHIKMNQFNAEACVVNLPYTIDKMHCVSDKKLRKAMLKAIKFLIKLNIRQAVLTKELKQIFNCDFNIDNFQICIGTDLFLALIPALTKKILNGFGNNKFNKIVGIIDRELGVITKNIIEELCYDVNNIKLYTNNKAGADKLCELIMYERGLVLSSFDYESDKSRDDISIDVDKMEVTVGRGRVIDNIVLEFYQNAYDVDTLDLAACVGFDKNKAAIKTLVSKTRERR